MMYEIGIITTTHGIKGELKIRELSDFDRFIKGEKVFIIENNERVDLTITSVRKNKNALIVKFNEFNNINEVIKFKNFIIYSETQGELLDNEYYFQDLIDLEAFTNDNEYIGIVTEVIEVPQGHILEIKDQEKKVLIPFREEFIVDISETKIIIKPIEGLIWK